MSVSKSKDLSVSRFIRCEIGGDPIPNTHRCKEVSTETASMAASPTDELSVRENSGIVTVELNRPQKLNALTPTMVEGLHAVFTELDESPPEGVLLTGRGRATCAGMDTEIVSGDYETDFADTDALAQELYTLVEELPCPVAMAAKGALVGIGFVISLSCEFLVVGTETTLSIPEVKYEIASRRTAERLPDLIADRPAAELLLTGDAIAPERADDLGLANAVVSEDTVEEHARDLLTTVAAHDRETVAEICQLLGGGSKDVR